jgi:hypothetical protein
LIAVPFTLVYWFTAITLLGMAIMGDSIDVEACDRSKQLTLRVGLLIAVLTYTFLMIFHSRQRP